MGVLETGTTSSTDTGKRWRVAKSKTNQRVSITKRLNQIPMSENTAQLENNVTINPSVFGLLLFGFLLVVIGTYNVVGGGEGALVFALFIAGVGELLAGLWEVSRGRTHLGNVMVTFGIWILGLFLLETVGGELGLATPLSLSIYFLALLGPVVLMYVPVYKNELDWAVHLAFVALFLLPLFTGVSFLNDSQIFVWLSGLSAYLAAFAIWTLAYEEIHDSMVERDAVQHTVTSSQANSDD